ncbi:MAG: DUF3224 domain-containing protein [Thermoplasmata archaeon]|jgi:hypothetical protein|nr:DUF3224 domain-containing protein [Thermoplasmata archaeon]
MTVHAAGKFEVTLVPIGADDQAPGSTLGQLSIGKRFEGDLVAVSQGRMMTAMTETEGSAGYVAIERVTGTLHGRAGSFVLQHGGIMTRGVPQLTILVVPDSGTGQLVGLAGKMAIIITDGQHSYDFQYTLPDPVP